MTTEHEPSDEIDGELVPGYASQLAQAIREALGVSESETVRVYAPPHRSRGDGKEVTHFPLTREEFEALRTLPRARLIELGLRPWDESGLLLFPMEWYPLIPAGFDIITIAGKRETFVPGETDNDCRFGVLAYGIIPEAAS
jgi:hypothetical protein